MCKRECASVTHACVPPAPAAGPPARRGARCAAAPPARTWSPARALLRMRAGRTPVGGGGAGARGGGARMRGGRAGGGGGGGELKWKMRRSPRAGRRRPTVG